MPRDLQTYGYGNDQEPVRCRRCGKPATNMNGRCSECFEQEYQNVPPEQDVLLEFGLRYHRECEAFDHSVCSRKTREGVAIPETPAEARAVNRYAIMTLHRLETEMMIRKLATVENVRQLLRDAIGKAAPIFQRELQKK